MCRDNVEYPYYYYSEHGMYDIRHPWLDPTPPKNYLGYLAKESVLNVIGVDINYTKFNQEIYYAFQQTGEWVCSNFLESLEDVLSRPVRVGLVYGDADYICNWFEGEAVSLAVNYYHGEEFRRTSYAPFWVDGVEYGMTREFGNLSFTRIYEAGHGGAVLSARGRAAAV